MNVEYTAIRVSKKNRDALHILKHEMRYSSIEKVLDRLIVLGIQDIKRRDNLLFDMLISNSYPATE